MALYSLVLVRLIGSLHLVVPPETKDPYEMDLNFSYKVKPENYMLAPKVSQFLGHEWFLACAFQSMKYSSHIFYKCFPTLSISIFAISNE